MTKVVSMARTSEYWISRARKHRLAGRYDEAMALLAKTREQYGTGEALERELAQTYDEMGCEEEAARAYLRVARMKGSAVPVGAFSGAARGADARGFLFRSV